ncbi:Retrovirus-related Pol polyprotein from transposon TNT 1-94 [Eumeta japonica]|uniref:Retrovirus-related Pol polyprotein from transposon TNT 1-94 n=1 Tax=Eumeta variegata TaxID=151549 RepID=A0A4C1VA17_EUMVA|nr:Retrovirus-related Pol polyprotein from transposon TNT 1-94 [Eumeta japonica]
MSHGIVHHKTNPYTPEQNGLSERYNRTIVEKAKCLLFDAGLEKRFWAEAAHTAVYLQNRTVTTSLNYRTPFEIWTGRKPDAEKCILVGYSNDVKGYRIYNPKSNVITTSRDVIVLEEIETENNVLEVQENCSDDVNIVPVWEEDLTLQEVSHEQSESLSLDDSGEMYVPCENETLDSSESGTTDSEDSIIFNNVNVISGPRRRQQPDRFGFASACIEDDQMFTGEILLQEALEGPEKAQWLEAVQEELQSFEKNSAWELVDVPKDGTIVQCKWVLQKKVR